MKEPVAIVQSRNGEHHTMRLETRAIYRYKDGSEMINWLSGRREVQRTKSGLAVVHIDWRSLPNGIRYFNI